MMRLFLGSVLGAFGMLYALALLHLATRETPKTFDSMDELITAITAGEPNGSFVWTDAPTTTQ
jgi:hypothetical protein